ncbi:S-methyl-5-thioribose kinase [Fulvimarina endophytica]|nr:S-methyl-5-thioribose kinase [Fulvimarina endophytica]
MAETTTVQKTEGRPDYSSYRPMEECDVAQRLATYPEVVEVLGGRPTEWAVREVGDGNLNFVYIVKGPNGSLCAKQALPFVRLVGESWPLPLDRSHFEHGALVRQAQRSGHVPKIVTYDPGQALIVMENLGRHKIWRNALIAGERHESAADVLANFMAETLFRSSDLSLDAASRKVEMVHFAANTALCKITEDLVFTDPYRAHELNRWTSPELDDTVAAIRADAEWKHAVQEMKALFLTRTEALLHGDLHTGSVMVSRTETGSEDVRIIDPEFAYYGPMGFDVGALMANLLLAFYAQDGLADDRSGMKDWLLAQVERVWSGFAERFTELWRTERTGDSYHRSLFEDVGDEEASAAACNTYLARLQVEAIGFAGAKMARRILGLAHVADLETIEPAERRAKQEKRALALARMLLVERHAIGNFAEACERARQVDGEER